MNHCNPAQLVLWETELKVSTKTFIKSVTSGWMLYLQVKSDQKLKMQRYIWITTHTLQERDAISSGSRVNASLKHFSLILWSLTWTSIWFYHPTPPFAFLWKLFWYCQQKTDNVLEINQNGTPFQVAFLHKPDDVIHSPYTVLFNAWSLLAL